MPCAVMRFLVVLALLLAVLSGLATSATSASAQEPTLAERRAALEAAVVREMNRARAARGLRALRATPSLRAAARSHSRAMLDLGFFAHESADGTSFSDRIRHYYPSRGWQAWSVGEALLASHGREIQAAAIVSMLLASPPHRTIVLGRSWRDVGIGALYAPSAPNEFEGAEVIAVTADFGLRTSKRS